MEQLNKETANVKDKDGSFHESNMKERKNHQKIITATYKDKNALYAAYMPFIQGGGLFVPTNKPFELGDDVFLLIQLMDETEKMPVEGKVVWITPRRAQGNRVSGIGIQFFEDYEPVRNKIEVYLVGLLQSDRRTSTM